MFARPSTSAESVRWFVGSPKVLVLPLAFRKCPSVRPSPSRMCPLLRRLRAKVSVGSLKVFVRPSPSRMCPYARRLPESFRSSVGFPNVSVRSSALVLVRPYLTYYIQTWIANVPGTEHKGVKRQIRMRQYAKICCSSGSDGRQNELM